MTWAVSLFSGCGGCSFGLRQAGIPVVLAAEIEKDACGTYTQNLGGIWNVDLRGMAVADLLQRLGVGVGEIPLLTAGPPCQGFSSAGAKNWFDERNALLKKFVDLVLGN